MGVAVQSLRDAIWSIIPPSHLPLSDIPSSFCCLHSNLNLHHLSSFTSSLSATFYLIPSLCSPAIMVFYPNKNKCLFRPFWYDAVYIYGSWHQIYQHIKLCDGQTRPYMLFYHKLITAHKIHFNCFVQVLQKFIVRHILNTHPYLSIVISCSKASAVPGESTASDTLRVTTQCLDTLPGLAVPQL